VRHATRWSAPAGQPRDAQAQGLHDEALQKIEKALAGAFEIGFVFNRYVLGEEF
jgi:hypothetical protein